MRLILKNLKQLEYEIHIESNSITVKDLKLEIEKLYSFDSNLLKLLFNGMVLDNSKLLSEYNIKENSIIIMMNNKIKQSDQKANINNTHNINQNNVQVQAEAKPNISEILKDNLKIQIDSLVDMGFERSQVEIAVKAANGRIDLAVEYLNNGIPDNNRNNNIRNNNTRNNNHNEITRELKKQAGIIKVLCKDNKYMIFTILDNIKRNDPGLLRLITDYQDEFKRYLDTPITEEEESNYKNVETKADEIIKKRLEDRAKKLNEMAANKTEKKDEKKIDKEEKQEDKKDEKQEDKKDEKQEDKKEEKQEDKKEEKQEDKKEEMKEEKEIDKKEDNLNKEDDNIPNKSEEKKENSDSKMNIEEEKENIQGTKKVEENINKDSENKENINKEVNNNNNQLQNQLTEEDNETIERLKKLGGFSHDKVVEAYIVCNKNEELTANYLFEQNN